MATHVGEERVSRGQPRPFVPRDGPAASPAKILISYMGAHSTRNSNQLLHGDQTRCEEKFDRVDHVPLPALAEISGDKNADVRSVCNS